MYTMTVRTRVCVCVCDNDLIHHYSITEVFVFSTLIGYFLIYLTLSAVTTSWSQQGQLLHPL